MEKLTYIIGIIFFGGWALCGAVLYAKAVFDCIMSLL